MTPHSLSGARADPAWDMVHSPEFGHGTEAGMVVNCGWGGVVVRPTKRDWMGTRNQMSVLGQGGEEEGRRHLGVRDAWLWCDGNMC